MLEKEAALRIKTESEKCMTRKIKKTRP